MPDTDAELVLQPQREQMETDLLVASADEAVVAIRRRSGGGAGLRHSERQMRGLARSVGQCVLVSLAMRMYTQVAG
jgi:hypothetical protein